MKFLWKYGGRMPFVQAPDRTKLYCEGVGTGSAIIDKAHTVGHSIGDEDALCLEGSFFLKRAAPIAALLVIPLTGHNVAAETGRWLAHKKAT
jgi:hypothetical protein